MSMMMKLSCLLILLVGTALSFEYEHVEDSCNAIAYYMKRKGLDYTQKFSKEPEEPLKICGSGTTCCTTGIEQQFFDETNIQFRKINLMKDPYIRKLTRGRDNIVDYMTQVLTMAHSHNERTKKLVTEFMDMTKYKIQTIDPMQYPVSILLDIAQSNRVNNVLAETDCIAEMRDYLHPLAAMQIDALKLARLLYQSIPLGSEVLLNMKNQVVSNDCINQIVRAQRCSECRDGTDVKPCRPYCMAITEKCFSHLTPIAGEWEKFATWTDSAMDKLDRFAKVYQQALKTAIQRIVDKLRDHDIADMCGYDVSKNLASKQKRNAEVRESKVRKALYDGSFMRGMLGKISETHCRRYSTEEVKCWNGTSVGLFTGSSAGIQITNDATVTPELTAALGEIRKFNEEFKTVDDVKIQEVEYNSYGYATEAPEFVKDNKDNGALHTALLSIGLFLVSLLLH